MNSFQIAFCEDQPSGGLGRLRPDGRRLHFRSRPIIHWGTRRMKRTCWSSDELFCCFHSGEKVRVTAEQPGLVLQEGPALPGDLRFHGPFSRPPERDMDAGGQVLFLQQLFHHYIHVVLSTITLFVVFYSYPLTRHIWNSSVHSTFRKKKREKKIQSSFFFCTNYRDSKGFSFIYIKNDRGYTK